MATITEIRVKPPPMEFGDRLTRAEFERRWEEMPHVKKAELIDGAVYMPSAVRYEGHGRQHGILGHWLGSYAVGTPGTDAADNSSVRLDDENEPQPDLLLRFARALGGQSWVDEEGYLNGVPELVVEIAASIASYDLHQKLDVYRRHGVPEYLVWRVFDREVDWFCLRDGNYERLAPDADGLLRSRVFPGVWLDPNALVQDNRTALVEAASRGLASPEHADLVARLEQKRRSARSRE